MSKSVELADAGRRPASIAAQFRTRLLLLGFTVIALSVVATALSTFKLRRDALTELLDVSTQLSAEQIEQFILHYRSALVVVARQPPADKEWAEVLQQVKTAFPSFVTLLVADGEGSVTHGHPLASDGSAWWLESNVADRHYFREPMRTGKAYVSPVFRGRTFGSAPIVAVSAPILDASGVPLGVVEGSIQSEDFAELRSKVLARLGFSLLVVDQDGVVIFASEKVRLGPLYVSGEHVSSSLVGDGVPMNATRISGLLADETEAYAAGARTDFGWTVVVAAPVDTLVRQVRYDWLIMLLPALAAVLVLVAAADWFARRLARPIGELARLMREFRPGEMAPRAGDMVASLELNEFARAFDRMGDDLERAFAHAQAALAEQRRLTAVLEQTLSERERVIMDRTIALRQANDQLQQLANTDSLTGCMNHRGFRERLEEIWAEAGAIDHASLSLIAVDVDHFKSYNDSYGHPAGDTALRRMAGALRAAIRHSDSIIARVGGEEFVAVLAGADRVLATDVANRIRRNVSELGIPHRASACGHLTVSIGVASVVLGVANNQSPDEVLRRADDALYRAKALGRNRVES